MKNRYPFFHLKKRLPLTVLTILIYCGLAHGQSIFTNPITGTNPNTDNPYTTGQTVDANITVSGIGRGDGINGNFANDRYNANNWNSIGIDLTDYFEWVITPNAAFKIDFVSLVYTGQRSGNGPSTFELRSSVDGFMSSIGTPTATGTTISLSAATFQGVTGAITFRLYGWGAPNSAGTFSINSFTFNGTVSPIPVVSIEATDAAAAEEGAATGTFRISRTGPTTEALQVSYTVAGTASSADYTPALSGTATIPVGQSFTDITITPVDDDLVEGPETVVLTLAANAAYNLSANVSATVNIQDNDFAYLTFTPSQASVNEGAGVYMSNVRLLIASSPAGGTLQDAVTVELVGVELAVSNGATFDDFMLVTTSVTFPAGSAGGATQPFSVNIIDDDLVEGDEFFDIAMVQMGYTGVPSIVQDNQIVPGLCNGNNNDCRNRQTIRIVDNDLPDYTITTTGNAIVITDLAGNGETLEVTQNGSNIRFNVADRIYTINGGAGLSFPADISLTGATSISINSRGGDDIINIGAFTTNLPNLTIDGGDDNDIINFTGTINFVPDNDLVVINAEVVNINGNQSLFGAGSIDISSNESITISAPLTCVSGNITLSTAGGEDILVQAGINGIQSSEGTITIQAGQDLVFGSNSNFGDIRGQGLILSAERDLIVGFVTYVQADGSMGATSEAGRNLTISGSSLINTNSGGALNHLTAGTNGQLTINNNSSIGANNGPIILVTDNISLNGSIGTIATVTLLPFSPELDIDLGTKTMGSLSLTEAEINQVSAGTLIIGDINSGTITVSADITRNTPLNMELRSGGDVLFSGGGINTGGGSLLLNPGISPAAVKPNFPGTDVTASTLSFASDLEIFINGTSLGDGTGMTYSQLKVIGGVNLQGVNLKTSGSYSPVHGNTFLILDNDGVDPISNTFIGLGEGSIINNILGTSFNAQITYIGGDGNDVVLTVIDPCLTLTIAPGDVIQPLCFGGNDGFISVAVTGGNPPYNFSWEESTSIDSLRNDLGAGSYTIYLEDNLGCEEEITIILGQPTQVALSLVNLEDETCPGEANGSIEVAGTGGTGSKSFLWSNDATSGLNENLIAGSYTVTVTDGNSCTAEETYEILSTEPLLTFYRDIDGDGLGDPNDFVMACTAPDGYVADNTDACPLTVSSVSNSGNCGCASGEFPIITLMSGEDVITGCQPCPAGTYCPDGLSAPIACPEGFFSSTQGAESCTPCAAGTANNQTGQTACVDCPVGTFSDQLGATECTTCPEGTSNSLPGQTSCVDCPLANIAYVNFAATGANNGTSWEDAFTDLQDALASSCPGITEIWVAAGTYKPSAFPAGCTGCQTDRDFTFLLKDGVSLYGGFAGTETMLNERDIAANPTVLSGDIGTIDDASDNVHHVVLAAFADETSTTHLDGFIVTGGNADVISIISINATTIFRHSSGGVYTINGIHTMTNNTISGNSASNFGGGVYAERGTINLTNNTISGNSANSFGGGVYAVWGTINLTNNTISGNSANFGGGIFSTESTYTLANNNISGNGALVGGGVYAINSTINLTNNTISGNSASIGGGINSFQNITTLTNNIIWGNSSGIGNDGSTLTVSNSIIQGGFTPCNDCPNTNGDLDPQFIDPLAPGLNTGGDYRLLSTSPAINAGDNAAYLTAAGIDPADDVDLDGNPRLVGTNIDIGAYEAQCPNPIPDIQNDIACEGSDGEERASISVNLPGSPDDYEAIWIIGNNPAGITAGTEFGPGDDINNVLTFNTLNRRMAQTEAGAPAGVYDFCVRIKHRNSSCESDEVCGFSITVIPTEAPVGPDVKEFCENETESNPRLLSVQALSNMDLISVWTIGANPAGYPIGTEFTPGNGDANFFLSVTTRRNLRIEAAAPVGTYEFCVKIRNTATGCESAEVCGFSITKHQLPTNAFRPAGTVVVTPFSAVLDYDSDHDVCQGEEVTYGAQAPTAGINTISWSISGGGTILEGESSRNVKVKWDEPGMHTLTFDVTNIASGCTNTNTLNVKVNELPDGSISNSGLACEGDNVLLNFTATAGNGPYLIVVSDVNSGNPVMAAGEGSPFWTLVAPAAGSTNYELQSISDTNGCTTTLSETTTVVVNSPPIVTLDADDFICVGSTITFDGTITPATPAMGTYTYNWCAYSNGEGTGTCFTGGFIPGSTSPIPVSRAWLQVGDRSVGLTVSTPGCPDVSQLVSFNVVAQATVSITVTDMSGSTDDDGVICLGDDAILTATTSGGTGTPTFSWESSIDGGATWDPAGIGNQIMVSPAQTTEYRVSVSFDGVGCDGATSAPVFILLRPEPKFNFVFTNPSNFGGEVCNGAEVEIDLILSEAFQNIGLTEGIDYQFELLGTNHSTTGDMDADFIGNTGYGPVTASGGYMDNQVISEINEGLSHTNSGPVWIRYNFAIRELYCNKITEFRNVVVKVAPQPILTNCPGDINVSSDVNDCATDVMWTHPALTAACDPVILTISINGSTPTVVAAEASLTENFEVGTYSVVYMSADGFGNTKECSFTIIVKDEEAPTIICPGTQTIALGADCTATLPDYRSLSTSDDNCGIQSVTQSPSPGTTVSGAGSMTVSLIVTDVNGLTANCSFTVTKVDNTPPTIDCPATQTLVLGSSCSAALPNYTGLAVPADNCGIQSVTQSPAAGTIVSSAGNMSVTLTVTDVNGLTSDCTFTVVKVDNTPPTIACPSSLRLLLGADCTAVLPDYTLFTAVNDNCGVESVMQSPEAGTLVSGAGDLFVTITATDINGLSSDCIIRVEKTDITAPTISCPGAQTLVLDAACSASLPDYTGLASVADNCGVQGITQSPAAGTTVTGAGNMTVSLIVTDVNGLTSSCSFAVSKIDNTPPMLICPDGQILSLNVDCIAVLPDFTGMAEGSDNCGTVIISQSPAPGTIIAEAGNVTVTLTATDLGGNTTNCQVVVSVQDNNTPSIQCPADFTVAMSDPNGFPAPDLTEEVIANACSGIASIVQSPVSGTSLSQGPNEITLTVTSNSGGTTDCVVIVTGEDESMGLEVTCPDDIVVNTENCTDTEVSVTYEVDKNPSFSIDYNGNPPGSNFPIGTTPVTVTVSDAIGNTGTCSFTVTVNNTDRVEVLGNGLVIENGSETPQASNHTKFPTVAPNGQASRTFTILNQSSGALDITAVQISGADAGQFALANFSAGTLSDCGETMTFTVNYYGTSAAAVHEAEVTVVSSLGDHTFAISGATSLRRMQVRGNNVNIPDGNIPTATTNFTDFGNVNFNTTRPRSFFVHNLGTQVLNLTGNPRVQVTGPSAALFNVSLQPAATVLPGGSRQLTIVFTASAVGTHVATVSIESDDAGATPYTFNISANVLNPNMSVLGNNILIPSGDDTPMTSNNTDFGTRNVNSNTILIYQIRNAPGSGILALLGSPRVEISGPGAEAFSIALMPNLTIGSGGTGQLRIRFTPPTEGVFEATVTIINNDTMPGKNPYTFAIRGATPGAALTNPEPWAQPSDRQIMELTAYPNPTKEVLFLKGPLTKEPYRLEVLNIEGRVVNSISTTGGRFEYRTTHLQPGIYLIRAIGIEVPVLRFVKVD